MFFLAFKKRYYILSDRIAVLLERQRIAESAVRTVYIHTHMDEDTFDCSRAMLCPDLVPAEPGRLIESLTDLAAVERERMLSGTALEFLGLERTRFA